MSQVMTGDDIRRALRRISHEILENHREPADLVLIGIHTRGVVLARILGDTMSAFSGEPVTVGELDIGLYRDDRDLRADIPVRQTKVPVAIDGRVVVVVDDVFYTGRTARAALDALSDLGRSQITELAVLIDRGHRELPIRADYIGKNLPTSREERVSVRLLESDGSEGVFIEKTQVGVL